MILAVKGIFISIALGGWAYGFYCQTKARQHISREKLATLTDTSLVARGVMPSKEILDDEGLKYHSGFRLGMVIFVGSIIILAILTKLYGS